MEARARWVCSWGARGKSCMPGTYHNDDPALTPALRLWCPRVPLQLFDFTTQVCPALP